MAGNKHSGPTRLPSVIQKNILEEVIRGENRKVIAAKYNVSQSYISGLVKDRLIVRYEYKPVEPLLFTELPRYQKID